MTENLWDFPEVSLRDESGGFDKTELKSFGKKVLPLYPKAEKSLIKLVIHVLMAEKLLKTFEVHGRTT